MSDFELIRRMADQNADPSEARDAWACFYVRHCPFLMALCTAKHGRLLGEEGVKDIVHETFMNAFDGAMTFDHGEECEMAVQQCKTRSWLVRIALNLMHDRYREKPQICIVDDQEMERLGGTTEESPVETQVPESERLKLLKSGLALLSDLEQTILRETMFWWQPDQQHQRMPHAAMEQLSTQTGKSPDNIRQIRSRAVKKLEQYVNENLYNEKAN